MERTAEEWGQVAVGLPGWRWMRGMSIAARGCDSEAIVDYPPSLIYVSDGGTDERGYVDHNTDYPDPDDAATAGCLLALLGSGVDTCSCGDGVDVTLVDRKVSAYAKTIGRACIATAEALGRWPGGAQ